MWQTTDGVRSSLQSAALIAAHRIAAMRDMHALGHVSWRRGHATASPDLNELRGFCVAADLGSLGRAAVRLHVSQPSLSKRLASLEAKVGARLLERSPRGVALTPAGRRLYRHARPLLEAADQVAEVMVGHPPDRRRRAPGRQPLGERGVRRGAADAPRRAASSSPSSS